MHRFLRLELQSSDFADNNYIFVPVHLEEETAGIYRILENKCYTTVQKLRKPQCFIFLDFKKMSF